MFFNFTTFKENEVIYHVDVPVDTTGEKYFGKRIDTPDHGSYTKRKPVDYQISLEPFETVAEKRKMIHFEGQNEAMKQKLDDENFNKRRPLAKIQETENQMSIFEDKNVMADWFSAWTADHRADQANHQKEIENRDQFLGREQFLRAKEIQLRAKDQDIIKRSVEAQIKTSNDVMAMLQRFESRLHEKNEKSYDVIQEANMLVDESDENQD